MRVPANKLTAQIQNTVAYLEIRKEGSRGTFHVYIFKSGQNLAYFFHIKFQYKKFVHPKEGAGASVPIK